MLDEVRDSDQGASEHPSESLSDAGLKGVQVLPIIKAALEMTSMELKNLIQRIKKSLAENKSVINTYASDEDRYFHYW